MRTGPPWFSQPRFWMSVIPLYSSRWSLFRSKGFCFAPADCIPHCPQHPQVLTNRTLTHCLLFFLILGFLFSFFLSFFIIVHLAHFKSHSHSGVSTCTDKDVGFISRYYLIVLPGKLCPLWQMMTASKKLSSVSSGADLPLPPRPYFVPLCVMLGNTSLWAAFLGIQHCLSSILFIYTWGKKISTEKHTE